MKKIFVTLLALLLLLTTSCTKVTPLHNDVGEEKNVKPPLTDLEQVQEYISQGEFEDAYTLLLNLETDEAKELLSHFSFKASSHETTLHDGEKYSEYREYDNHGNITKKTVDNGEHGYVTENTYDELLTVSQNPSTPQKTKLKLQHGNTTPTEI